MTVNFYDPNDAFNGINILSADCEIIPQEKIIFFEKVKANSGIESLFQLIDCRTNEILFVLKKIRRIIEQKLVYFLIF